MIPSKGPPPHNDNGAPSAPTDEAPGISRAEKVPPETAISR